MTTDQLIARLQAELGLTPDQSRRLLPTLAGAVAEALQSDGMIWLGELGLMRLGVQEAKTYPDRIFPERTMPFFRPSQTLSRAMAQVPASFARWVAEEARRHAQEREGVRSAG
jgi:nucleoid DNA-binding protein